MAATVRFKARGAAPRRSRQAWLDAASPLDPLQQHGGREACLVSVNLPRQVVEGDSTVLSHSLGGAALGSCTGGLLGEAPASTCGCHTRALGQSSTTVVDYGHQDRLVKAASVA